MRAANWKIIVVFLLSLSLGCDENLNTEPTDTLTPEQLLEDPINLDKTLIGAYAVAESLQGEYQTMTELLANEADLAYRGLFPELFELDRKIVTAGNSFIRFFWFQSYASINLYNIVLDNLDLEEDGDIRALLEGEAKFLRALQYFEMVRFFALPFEVNAANSQLGLPLVLDGVTDLSEVTYPGRSNVDEVYSQVIADLQDAYAMLPDNNGNRADRYAALAVLARVYLQQGDFQAARDAAHDVLLKSGHTLAPDLISAFNNESDGVEDIFAIQVTTQSGRNNFNLFWATIEFGGRYQTAEITIEPPFFEIFDAPDDRAEFFYEGNGTTVTSKWQERFANVPFIRISEMHLIRAECNFREGTSLGLSSEDEINALRLRSNADPIIGITLEDILNERYRELAFEGQHLHDAKRLKEDIAGIAYDADQLVMPIPQDEIEVNPNLEQNPGYNN
ncbi:MAG: RagB/SusD family nutrient uptake outer membrane protein [Flavobacteriaceae bacterium]